MRLAIGVPPFHGNQFGIALSRRRVEQSRRTIAGDCVALMGDGHVAIDEGTTRTGRKKLPLPAEIPLFCDTARRWRWRQRPLEKCNLPASSCELQCTGGSRVRRQRTLSLCAIRG